MPLCVCVCARVSFLCNSRSRCLSLCGVSVCPLVLSPPQPPIPFSVEDLMHLACSSVFCGGGTNQELALHCLYECNGDIMVSSQEASRPCDKAAVVCDGWTDGWMDGGREEGRVRRLCRLLSLLRDSDVTVFLFFFPLRERKVDFFLRCRSSLMSIRRDGIPPTPSQVDVSSVKRSGSDAVFHVERFFFCVFFFHSDRAKNEKGIASVDATAMRRGLHVVAPQ